jgi:hypothetical protein
MLGRVDEAFHKLELNADIAHELRDTDHEPLTQTQVALSRAVDEYREILY